MAYLLSNDEDSFWSVERITGLDPASPCFKNLDRSLKLDDGDAKFVDIIHTEAADVWPLPAFGMGENIG